MKQITYAVSIDRNRMFQPERPSTVTWTLFVLVVTVIITLMPHYTVPCACTSFCSPFCFLLSCLTSHLALLSRLLPLHICLFQSAPFSCCQSTPYPMPSTCWRTIPSSTDWITTAWTPSKSKPSVWSMYEWVGGVGGRGIH